MCYVGDVIPREHKIYRLLFVFILAPVGAVVIVAALLLFGVRPHTVCLAGHPLKSVLSALGVHTPNFVGVLLTVLLWWALIAAVGAVWERGRRNRAT